MNSSLRMEINGWAVLDAVLCIELTTLDQLNKKINTKYIHTA